MTINDVNSVDVKLNRSQALIQIINANTTYCLWPRAGGKTSGGIGPRLLHLSQVMPRAQILIVSDTYDRLNKRILPNVIGFFKNNLKLVEDIDFVMFKKPPDHWEEPLIPIFDFENVISFSSGLAVCLVSLRVPGSANAYNAQAMIVDETKYCDPKKLDTEVIPALRGAKKQFEHLPEYLSKWHFTDKYLDEAGDIYWLLKKRDLVDSSAIEVVYTFQMEIFKLQNKLREAKSTATIYEIKYKIQELEGKANRIRKHLTYVSEMQPFENMDEVGEFYFKSQKRSCSKLEYDVAILNKDPDKVENTYYPTFTEKNKYQSRNDYDRNTPFIIALDYQWSISPLPVVQISRLPGERELSVNFIDALFTLHPKGLEDAVNLFCDKYSDHLTKEVYYVHDHTAIGENPTKVTFSDVVMNTFIKRGWNVIAKYTGQAPAQNLKYQNIKDWINYEGEYKVMVNEITCWQMIKSIEKTAAITSGGKTQKDKRSERNRKIPAQDSTHFSDAFDMILWAIFEHNLKVTMNQVGIAISIG